jgi:hypothetical protein
LLAAIKLNPIISRDMSFISFPPKINKNPAITNGRRTPPRTTMFLFILGGKLIKDISLLMIGFNLIAANKDLLDIGLSENIVTLSLTAGVLFLIGGISLLVKSRVEGGLIL